MEEWTVYLLLKNSLTKLTSPSIAWLVQSFMTDEDLKCCLTMNIELETYDTTLP